MTIKCEIGLLADSLEHRLQIYYKKKHSLFYKTIVVCHSWGCDYKDFLDTVETFVFDNLKEKVIELVKQDIKERDAHTQGSDLQKQRLKNINNELKNMKFEFEFKEACK